MHPTPTRTYRDTHGHQAAQAQDTMRLITHNMLKSNIKGVVNGFPLRIEGDKVDVRESEFSAGKMYVCVS